MNRTSAEKLSVMMLRISGMLDDSIAFVRDAESKEDFELYRDQVSRTMASMHLDVLEQIWKEHPSLRPKQMGGSYEVDPAIHEPRFYDVR